MRKLLHTFCLVTLVGAAAIATAGVTIWLICRVTKVPDVSRLGYTSQWRLDYLTTIDRAFRAATLARISRQLNDPATTYALQKFALAFLFSGDREFYKVIADDFHTRLTLSPGRICGEPFYGTNWPRNQQQLPLIGCLGGLRFRELRLSNLLSATEPFRD